MFWMYNVSLSVSQSVSPVFLVSANPLKPLNRISLNFVVMKDIICIHVYMHIHRKFDSIFFLRSYPLLNLEI